MENTISEVSENTIYILDSYGLIYRAYFAFIKRPLTNSKGENVSAIFGFFKNLHAIFSHYKPKYIAAAFDSITPTFRHEMYKEYKATRAKTPEDLHAQIPIISDILKSLGVPILQCDGYEADDIIATVATKAREQGRKCRILSGDKDLMQLVCDTTQILKPDTSTIWKVIDANGVKAEWGVLPSKMLDLLSLIGDVSDNVPGVKGIGIKTACKYLDEYGSLDKIFENVGDIKGSAGQKLICGKESAYFSQKLIKLCESVPCIKNLENDIQKVNFNFAEASKKLKLYEINSVAKSFAELDGNITAKKDISIEEETIENKIEEEKLIPIKKNKGNYSAITKLAELTAMIDDIIKKQKLVAFDCETDSLNTLTAKIIGFSLCTEKGKAFYVPLENNDELFSNQYINTNDALSQLARLFTNNAVSIIMHNGKFDYEVLRSNGIMLGDGEYIMPSCKIIDTMVAAWLLEPDKIGGASYSLEYLSEKKLALSGIEYDDIVQKGQTFLDVPLEKAVDYAAEDADFTFQLWAIFEEQLAKNNLLNLFTNIEMKLLPILAEMEIKGIHLNKNALNKYDEELTKEIETVQKEIYSNVGHEFNIASPKQLQEVLFSELQLKPGKKTKTGYSTDTSVLEELSQYHIVPQKILIYREKAKLQSTYAQSLPKLCDKNGRVHTTYLQTGTATGRLSSRDPNLQNIPIRNEDGRRIRAAFTAIPKTILISADYSQIELVVLAHLSKDENMCKAFINGVDIHSATASLLFSKDMDKVTSDERRIAKTINFGILYGMSAFRLSNDLNISRQSAATFIENYFTKYYSIRTFIDDTVSFAEKNGYVETIFGRRRKIMNINSRNKLEKSSAERMAVNTPVQGSAADIVKQAMLDVSNALREAKNGASLLLQVHDELIFECPNDKDIIANTKEIIKSKMENAVKLNVPLRVSIEAGKNWGEFH